MKQLIDMVNSLNPDQKSALGKLLGFDNKESDKTHEPIAVIGMGARFPGADSIADYWKLLINKTDAVRTVPSDRWRAADFYHVDKDKPGKMATQWGGFLRDIDQFDASFFGITPREAEMMDPQQRVFLETTWAALDNAAIAPQSLSGSNTGVFVGVSNFDYMWRQFADLNKIDAYASSGSSHSIIPNRISYLLNLSGPSIAIDSACSSSLVAVHQAMRSLSLKETDMAIAGGVNLILSPHMSLALSKWGMMASDGHCKTFDSRADGFVRGEGAGVIILKRLSDAENDGDCIDAVIAGSAVNQDGKTSGLTAPNGSAQQNVIRQALAISGLTPNDISYIETHGTGTSLGDPIEVEAINEIFSGQVERCVLGAVKTNIGHLESAAGIAGLIKVVLSLKNEMIPSNLHFERLNPLLTLESGLQLAQNNIPWQRNDSIRNAGVSAFSFGGTNAHIILQEAPIVDASTDKVSSINENETLTHATLLVLSACNEHALRDYAQRYVTFLNETTQSLSNICAQQAQYRDHFEHRLAFAASSAKTAINLLETYLDNRSNRSLLTGNVSARNKMVFVFSGQGNQWLGMGRELYNTEQVFRESIHELGDLFLSWTQHSFVTLLANPESDENSQSKINRTDIAQPLIFMTQVSLVRLLSSRGIKPDAVVGHSVGEIAAAWLANVFSLDDAVELVFHRSKLMQEATGNGLMATVALTKNAVQHYIANEEEVAIAAVNGLSEIVLSGSTEAMQVVLDNLQKNAIEIHKLPVTYAFHSAQMEPYKNRLKEKISSIKFYPASLPLYSTVTGEREDDKFGNVQYWADNMRETVEFCAAIQLLLKENYNYFLEIGPHAVLTQQVNQLLVAARQTGAAASCMRRDQSDQATLAHAIGSFYVQGYQLDWKKMYRGGTRRHQLPPYPWQKKRFWIDTKEYNVSSGFASGVAATSTSVHSLIYETQWKPLELITGNELVIDYAVIDNGSGVAATLCQEIEARGSRCLLVCPGEIFSISDKAVSINLEVASDYNLLMQHLLLQWGRDSTGRILMVNTSSGSCEFTEEISDTVIDANYSINPQLFAMQALQSSGLSAKLGFVTCGYGDTIIDSRVDDTEKKILSASVYTGMVWGFSRSIAVEAPELWLGVFDLEDFLDTNQVSQLVDLFTSTSLSIPTVLNNEHVVRVPETQFILFKKQWVVPRLASVQSLKKSDKSKAVLSLNVGSYLITGGTGSLGIHTARWLCSKLAQLPEINGNTSIVSRVILSGRSKPSAQTQRTINDLSKRYGVEVSVVQADVAIAADAQRMITIANEKNTLKGIIHAAGVVDDGLIGEQTADRFNLVLQPKVSGAINLHRFTQGIELDLFVVYSSATGTLGAAGQSSYGAANHFLATLCCYRRQRGKTALCVDWGPWVDSNMVNEFVQNKLAAFGFYPLEATAAFNALEELLVSDCVHGLVLNASWNTYLEKVRVNAVLIENLISDIDDGQQADESLPSSNIYSELMQALHGNDIQRHQKILYPYIKNILIESAGLDANDDISPDQGMIGLGVDSLIAVEMVEKLNKSFHLKLPRSTIYDYSTPAELTRYVLSEIPVPERSASSDEPSSFCDLSLEQLSGEDIDALIDEELQGLVN